MKRVMIAIAALLVVGLAVGAAMHFVPVDETPRVKATNDAIAETYARIVGYLKWKKRLPKTVDELRDADGPDIRTTDGWGRPLQYTITNDGFLLKSLGRDGRPGGSGADEDQSVGYRIDQPRVNAH